MKSNSTALSYAALFIVAFLLGWLAHDVFEPDSVMLEAEIKNQLKNKNIMESTAIAKSVVKIQSDVKPEIRSEDTMYQLLKEHRFHAAVLLYEQYYSQQDERVTENLHRLIVNKLNDLYKQKQYTELQQLADYMLEHFYQDFDALLAKANGAAQTEDVQLAIATFYQAIDANPGFSESKAIADTLHQLAAQQYKLLSQNNSWLLLREWCQELLNHEADFPPYYLYYATALIELEDYYQAESYLTPLLQDPELGDIAQRMLNRLYLLREGGSSVPLQRSGRHFIANLEINNFLDIKLLLDTGASFSSITPKLLAQLKSGSYSLLQNDIVISTANGTRKTSLYRVDSVTIENQTLYDMEFIVLSMDDDFSADGLLGMNILSQFQFQIDQTRAELMLEPR